MNQKELIAFGTERAYYLKRLLAVAGIAFSYAVIFILSKNPQSSECEEQTVFSENQEIGVCYGHGYYQVYDNEAGIQLRFPASDPTQATVFRTRDGALWYFGPRTENEDFAEAIALAGPIIE